MTALRKQHRTRYATIDNEILQDRRLSYRARGIASFIFSKPDGWPVTIENLMGGEGAEGRDAIRTALQELATLGYLMRRRESDTNGQKSTTTIVADYPAFIEIGTPEERINGYHAPTDLLETDMLETDMLEREGSFSSDLSNNNNGSNTNTKLPKTGGAFAAQKTPRVVAQKQPKAKRQRKPKQPEFGQGQLGIDDIEPEAMEEKSSEFKDMAAMIYEILGWNPKLVNTGYHIQVSKLVKELRDQRYNLDSLRDFWNHVWTNDFRWTKHHKHPSLADLRAGIGKLHTPVIPPAAPKKVYGLVQDKNGYYIRREAEDGQLPNGVAQLTPQEVDYYAIPRAKRMGEN